MGLTIIVVTAVSMMNAAVNPAKPSVDIAVRDLGNHVDGGRKFDGQNVWRVLRMISFEFSM